MSSILLFNQEMRLIYLNKKIIYIYLLCLQLQTCTHFVAYFVFHAPPPAKSPSFRWALDLFFNQIQCTYTYNATSFLLINFRTISLKMLYQFYFTAVCTVFAIAIASGPSSCVCNDCNDVNCDTAAKLCDSFSGSLTCSNSSATVSCDISDSECLPSANYECISACGVLGCGSNQWNCAGNKKSTCICEECAPVDCAAGTYICALYDGELQCTEGGNSATCANADSTCEDGMGNPAAPCEEYCKDFNCEKYTFLCDGV